MLETWQAWNGRETFARAQQRARAAGDHERADRLREMLARDRDVAALDALRAQHEMSALLAGWEWHTVRAAREQGATWADIARATRTDPEHARTVYLDQVGRQEQAAERGWLPFDDAAEYRAAAGEWVDELHPDTPAHVVEQIEAAIVRDDVDELAALRSAWWNPAHVTPLAVSEAATETAGDDGETNPWAAVAGTGQVPHTHTAAANCGHEDPASAAVTEHPDDIWGPVRPGLAETSHQIDQDLDANNGYTNYTVAEAVDRLTPPVLGAQAPGEQVRGYLSERHGRPEAVGGILEPDDLYAIVARAPRADDQYREAQRDGHRPDADAGVPEFGEGSGNDLAGDVERVLAHLRVQNTAHGRAAEPLWDMPPDRWEASLAVLRAGGYEIATATATHGDTATNGTGYWLDTDPGRDLRATSTTDQPDGPGWWAQARSTDPDVAPVTFDGSGFYSDAEVAAIGDALAVGDTDRAEALQDRTWLAHGDTAHVHVSDDQPAQGDGDGPWPAMPEWMRSRPAVPRRRSPPTPTCRARPTIRPGSPPASLSCASRPPPAIPARRQR